MRPRAGDDDVPPIGFMAWRIGDILDLDRQIEWIREHDFRAVSLHASSGVPGAWRGLDPNAADAATRAAFRARLQEGFRAWEVHAPFSAVMRAGHAATALAELRPVVTFAGDIGADICTVHADVPAADAPGAADWRRAMVELNALAAGAGIRIGLEITAGFETIRDWDLSHVGVTLDVGHMMLGDPPPIKAFECLGDVVRLLEKTLIHLHLHQVRQGVDHVELGAGEVDYESLVEALRDMDYRGMLCLELNPDRVSPAGIARSRAWLERFWRDQRINGPRRQA